MAQETVLTTEQAEEILVVMRQDVNSVPMGLVDSREKQQKEEEGNDAA